MAQKWTNSEIEVMNEMIAMKKSFNKIAKVLGRSTFAVKYKFGRQYRKNIKNKRVKNGSGSDYDSELETDSSAEEKKVSHHRRTFSNDSDPSIYVKYSPPISTCTLLSIAVAGGLSLFICGSFVFVTTLIDSLEKIKPS
jgi:hypothetical protein